MYFRLRAETIDPLGLYVAVSLPGTNVCLVGPTNAVSCPGIIRYLLGLLTVNCIVSFLGNTGGLRGVWRAALLAHHPQKPSVSEKYSA